VRGHSVKRVEVVLRFATDEVLDRSVSANGTAW